MSAKIVFALLLIVLSAKDISNKNIVNINKEYAEIFGAEPLYDTDIFSNIFDGYGSNEDTAVRENNNVDNNDNTLKTTTNRIRSRNIYFGEYEPNPKLNRGSVTHNVPNALENTMIFGSDHQEQHNKPNYNIHNRNAVNINTKINKAGENTIEDLDLLNVFGQAPLHSTQKTKGIEGKTNNEGTTSDTEGEDKNKWIWGSADNNQKKENVTLGDRSAFNADGCATGQVKIFGNCVDSH